MFPRQIEKNILHFAHPQNATTSVCAFLYFAYSTIYCKTPQPIFSFNCTAFTNDTTYRPNVVQYFFTFDEDQMRTEFGTSCNSRLHIYGRIDGKLHMSGKFATRASARVINLTSMQFPS